MTDAQAKRNGMRQRIEWWNAMRRSRPRGEVIPGRWYADNSREQIRDETFRVWKQYGALIEDHLPTTSSKPRYQLAGDFADLFNPGLGSAALRRLIREWQSSHLSGGARARIELLRRQTVGEQGSAVKFPDGTTRTLSVGPSTVLLRAVVEEFAPRFLVKPVVLTLTESRRRFAYEDIEQLRHLELEPSPRLTPDAILADLGTKSGALRLVFLECVATAGVMSDERVRSIKEWLSDAGFSECELVFGTVFADRGRGEYRKYASELAWGTLVWFASEPGALVLLLGGDSVPADGLEPVIQ
jgi:hypothetical protein